MNKLGKHMDSGVASSLELAEIAVTGTITRSTLSGKFSFQNIEVRAWCLYVSVSFIINIVYKLLKIIPRSVVYEIYLTWITNWTINLAHPVNILPYLSWYTDNGMFISSGRDGVLKVWDSNAGVVVEQFTGVHFNHQMCK